jgi:hypothetical protein
VLIAVEQRSNKITITEAETASGKSGNLNYHFKKDEFLIYPFF